MRIAYLVNQYPKTSHSFIRREIEGVEACGSEVLRYSIRSVDEPLVDERDRVEAARTKTLLSGGPLALAGGMLAQLLTHPLRLARAARLAWILGRRSERGRAVHAIYLAEACLLVRELHAQQAEHLHAHFGTNPAAVALLTRALGGPPYSFTAHGSESFDHPAFIGLDLKIEHAKFAVAVSEFGRSQLMRWSRPVDWHKLHCIRCGLDEAFVDAVPTPPPAAPHFVCIARFSEEKGHLVLLEALRRVRDAGRTCELTLVGDGHLRPNIERFLREHDLEGSVHLLGWQSGRAVRDAIVASRALVLPSFMEGLPVVLMEALALARPVIGTHVAGVPELVQPGSNGWLVPPGSPEALAAALIAALDTPPAELAAMGARGRSLVLERHRARTEAARLVAQSAPELPSAA